MKEAGQEVDLTKKKFTWGNVLVGLAMLHDYKQRVSISKSVDESNNSDAPSIYDTIDRTTCALAPFLVPMIDYLGALSADETGDLAQKGDDE
jgi:hypothetical protein